MPLVNLQTNLKSLKYGNDQPGGGSSGQPFITTDISDTHKVNVNIPANNLLNLVGLDKIGIPTLPNISAELNKTKVGGFVNTFLSGDDFIRGGAIGAGQAAANDTFRIGSFFLNVPKGPLFLAKQVALQFSNPKLEVKGQGGGAIGNLSGAIVSSVSLSAGGAIGSATGGLLGPTRIYNLGINTLAQIPVNALGGHFIRHGLQPGGDKTTTYEAVAKFNNADSLNNIKYLPPASAPTNRLLRLSKKFSLGPTNFKPAGVLGTVGGATLSGLGTVLRFISQKAQQWTGITFPNYNVYDTNIIDSYLGGPGSLYGIGSTTINRATYTNDEGNIKDAIKRSHEIAGQAFTVIGGNVDDNRGIIDYTRGLGTNSHYQSPSNSINAYTSLFLKAPIPSDSQALLGAINRYGVNEVSLIIPTITINPGQVKKYNAPVTALASSVVNSSRKKAKSSPKTPTYQTYANLIATKILTANTYADDVDKTIYNDFSIYARTADDIVDRTNYKNQPSTAIGYYNPSTITALKISGSWTTLSRERNMAGGIDVINTTPLFNYNPKSSINTITVNLPDPNNPSTTIDRVFDLKDLVPFQIEAIDGTNPSSKSTWMVFRAFLTNLSDDVNSNWVDIKYAGRGDKFYVYDGFTRKMNVSFKVAALSEGEMRPMYQKLNYLMGNLMPDYTSGGLMRGPLIRMTIGNYISNQLAKLDSLSYKIPQDSPWEISLGTGDEALILPHIIEVSLSFTPIGSETRGLNYAPQKNASISHIAQAPLSNKQYINPGIVRPAK